MRALLIAFCACLGGCLPSPTLPTPAQTPAPSPTPTPGPLTGYWVGLVAEDMGIKITDSGREDYCINYYDWEGPLTQTGTALSGPMTTRNQGADCLSGGRRYRIPPEALGGGPVTDPIRLTVTPTGGVSISWEDWVGSLGGAAGSVERELVGTYTATTLTFGGERTSGRSSYTTLVRLRKR